MTDSDFREPLALQRRPLNEALYQAAQAQGVHPLLARVLAGRLSPEQLPDPQLLSGVVAPALQYLPPPQLLADQAVATARLIQAIEQGERIGILTDYDVDGITSHVVFYRALTEWFGVPAERLHSLIGHRLNDGYGVSDPLVTRILDDDVRPSLIVTADCGSSDEARIARLNAAGIDVVVTDHHALPEEGPPASALAVINPTRRDCDYPDATIAGCMVAWLLMAALRQALIDHGRLPPDTAKLGSLLSYVALGTVADCVSLGASRVNRAVIRTGLSLINRFDRPCWEALHQLLGERTEQFDAGTLAFQVGPRINARSRMADPYAALHFMLAPDLATAQHYLNVLDSDNQDRRQVEQQMVADARQAAAEQVKAGLQSLVVYLDDGHSGVQGIVASRLLERHGRPTVVLTPANEPKQLVGSARSVPGVHIRDALQRVDQLYPDILVKFGGHVGAAGLTLWKHQLARFQKALDQAVRHQLGRRRLGPVLLTDGPLNADTITLATLDQLAALEPYGREFEAPVFEGNFIVENLRSVGHEGTHIKLDLSLDGDMFNAIWFRALPYPGARLRFGLGDTIRVAYSLDRNTWRGRSSIQLIVRHAEPAHTA